MIVGKFVCMECEYVSKECVDDDEIEYDYIENFECPVCGNHSLSYEVEWRDDKK